MRLYVYVLEASEVPAKDSYVKLRLGKLKSKTRVLKKSENPVWSEEFVFRVHDIEEELVVSVFQYDDDFNLGFFNSSRELAGRVRIPVWSIVAEENQCLPPTWFSLEKAKTFKSGFKYSGKILLTLSLHGRGHDTVTNHLVCTNASVEPGYSTEIEDFHGPSHDASKMKIPEGKKLIKTIANRLEKLFNKYEEDLRTGDSSATSTSMSEYEDCVEEFPSTCSFEEAVETMQSKYSEDELPENLQGGILVNQTYALSPKDLLMFIFAPNSHFIRDLAELQGTTDLQDGPWTWKSGDITCLNRVVIYTKAATKLVKAVKATEEQTCTKADKRGYVVFVSVSTPDVPYGNTFKVELLYKIMIGLELSLGEETSHLVVSWGINFLHSTMMRGMIEGGARQGLQESFNQFSKLLGQNFKTVDVLDKDSLLASLETEHKSDWQLAIKYFWNFTVVSAIFMALYVILHILLCEPCKLQGLEFSGLDLPDSFGELITCAILVIHLERVYGMVSHFVQARVQRGSDHGLKAQGDGWVLTVALIEGVSLASLDSMGFSDPYVVFTCNGKTRTSSVKLQTCDPHWNEVLEFDAMEEPPSVLDVEVFNFDGPFDQSTSLGHAEINFVKHTSTELADMWVPLLGKLAQSSQSKLHLRIFLENTNGVETIKDYLTKMEKEVGKKLSLRSPHRDSMFQKLFKLPPEEFLISDFSCSLRRKMPLQGRLFLSARIVGFYANLFGHKTKFFFLWEDIEDIEVLPPSLASVGSPTLVIVLKNGRGMDARQGAKSQDEEGRLRFYFQLFVPFGVASRTIMALWRTRTLTPEQKAQIAEEQQEQDGNYSQLEDAGAAFLNVESTKMSKIYSSRLPFDIDSVMGMFDGGILEHNVMGKSGCLNYVTTPWEVQKSDVYERHLLYKFNRHISIFGGEVACTQQKFPKGNHEGWVVDEVMTLHDVPFGDHFRVHFKYQMEKQWTEPSSCKCDVHMGIEWLRSTKFQQRISRNITDKFAKRVKEILQLLETEISLADGNLPR